MTFEKRHWVYLWLGVCLCEKLCLKGTGKRKNYRMINKYSKHWHTANMYWWDELSDFGNASWVCTVLLILLLFEGFVFCKGLPVLVVYWTGAVGATWVMGRNANWDGLQTLSTSALVVSHTWFCSVDGSKKTQHLILRHHQTDEHATILTVGQDYVASHKTCT